ncbi:hypothetical protein RN001_007738 [Aquatica leii]|uniref:F-box domain-containing protein n=1 Tax=Aquatica leii TaxID=1421715 RepID=A0AAN7PYF6_9COLE|nr:hypothetical protein RN001_007738 [Aquatica leii]
MTTIESRPTQILKSISQTAYDFPTWYHNLPTTILIKIFSFFDEKELLLHIIPVCKRWKYAGLNPLLWKTFQVSGEQVPTYFICHKLRDWCYLTTVRLNAISEPLIVIRQISRCLPNLKNFALRNSGVIPESCLRNLIQCCKHLELIDLSGTQFKANRFYEEIAGLTNLKSINFSKNIFLNVHNLLSIVLNCHKLEELKLASFTPVKPEKSLSDEDILFIITNLAAELKSLTLDASNLTNFSFKAIMQCSKLEKLGLYGARNISSDVFINIPKYLHNLKVLKIRDAHLITGTNLAEFFCCGKTAMGNLTSIDFTGCWKLSDIGVKAIAQCCPILEYLRLKSCKGVQNLSPIRDHCIKLKILNVAFCFNLDPSTILPLPEQLKVLIVDKNNSFCSFIPDILNNAKVTIKMCLSEYNKEMEDYKLNAINEN